MKVFAVVRRLLDLPIRKKLYWIVGILVAALAVVISIGVFGLWTLSSLRAAVGAEGLWARAQKNAVYCLERYALSREEKDYREYRDFLKEPLGDRKARRELEKQAPDLRVVDAGFIEGGNHPDDVRGLAQLFLRFHRVSYIKRAIALWKKGDSDIAELQAAAEDLHHGVAAGTLSRRELRRHLERLDVINDRLTAHEHDFSYALGEASRWAEGVLFWCMAAGALLFGGLGLLISLLISGNIADGIRLLCDAAARVERGDLKFRVEIETHDEIGRLGEAFNRMAEGLSRLDEMKNDFLATVSHELRTPLSLALAPLESILAGDMGGLNSEQLGMLEIMHNNVIRQLQLVTGLLDFSRVEAGKVEVKREPVDVAALTRSIVDDFRPLARGKGLRLDARADIPASSVLLDRYLYERIVFNLLSNAVKFTPRDGAIRVALVQSEGRLCLTVADTGIGIAAEDQARLFQKFRQIDSSSTRRFEGTGLGLALVREFASLLGGGVSVRSEPGRGSEFEAEFAAAPCAAKDASLRLPANVVLAQRYKPATEPLSRTLPAPGEPPGVLIAEDNQEFASYLSRLLGALGPVRVARDGEEALRLARELRPELVVADVMMPRLDGLGLCRALKSNPLTSSVPVVLLTALTDRESLTRGWKAGADEYLFKPFHPKEVVTRVRTLLESARARARAEAALVLKARELERSNLEVAAANEELKSFTSAVAHDLRAPLGNLDAYCTLLEKELAPEGVSPEGREHMRRIHGCVARMNGIILGLLQLSRAARRELADEDVDLSEAAWSIARELSQAQPKHPVDFIAAPGLHARGDGDLLRLVLRNLLENAWKYTSRHSAARVEFSALQLGGETVFFVRDDGAGFDMAYVGRLFGAFQRLHSPKDFTGTGIGLATVRRVVERHGGRVWVEAGVERGATFYFTLAARTAAPTGASSVSPARTY
ncbi:MAG: response regulator [Elusimicrobia bacterium]|nr:response regulator [Elusimicrobiota bacterium]